MGVVNLTEIKGAWINGKLLCQDCMDDDDWNNQVGENDFLWSREVEDAEKLYFCDECKNRIK
jgi:hypothetical protein